MLAQRVGICGAGILLRGGKRAEVEDGIEVEIGGGD